MMKCALEMRVALDEAMELARLAEEARLAEIERKRMMLGATSIQFCETVVARALEKAVKDCHRWVNIHLGCAQYGDFQGAVYQLRVSEGLYANGDDSCSFTGDPMNIDIIADYLRQHCYDVSIQVYWYKEYGCGWQEGRTLVITIPKNPCE